MINFEEEIRKFKPSLEIEDVENAIYDNEMQDIMDVMQMTQGGTIPGHHGKHHHEEH